MSNTYFKFKQFTINQDKTAMKVGVDGVLLGAWTNVFQAKSILDIGTGTGLLSLMLAQKSSARITAIELEENAYKQACENIKQSQWGERVEVVNSSIQEYLKNVDRKFDLIICNPPYFKKSLNSKDEFRNLARHDDNLPVEDLFECVQKLLSANGRFTIIYPYERKDQLYTIDLKHKLYPNKVLEVRGTEKKEPNRIIIEFSFVKAKQEIGILTVRDSLTNDYTKEYRELTKDYYLAF